MHSIIKIVYFLFINSCFRNYFFYLAISVKYNMQYESTPIQIYWKFSDKKSDIFHTSARNILCGYSLEPPRRCGSNEYPQFMFWAKIRKIMFTPVNPRFTIQKWSLRGSKLYRYVFEMGLMLSYETETTPPPLTPPPPPPPHTHTQNRWILIKTFFLRWIGERFKFQSTSSRATKVANQDASGRDNFYV